MKTILILLDTVRKDYLSVYNKDTDCKTPNISRLANDACIFNNHYTGSLPCMPARRDMATGRLDFFEREWGGLEPYDIVYYKELSLNGIRTHLCTDHYHYWELGGEGFMQYYSGFDIIRGQENDRYINCSDEKFKFPVKYHGTLCKSFEKNTYSREKKHDYPSYQTFENAIEFINRNKEEDFFLQIEAFDPHQPFACPQEYEQMYSGINNEEYYNCPIDGKSVDTTNQIAHARAMYKANLSFADNAIGMLLDYLQNNNLYDECNIIFTTDHGYHLGEHGYLGKGHSHPYAEVSQIPLIHKLPFQKEVVAVESFTQNIDLAPTICEHYDVKFNPNIHGLSYLKLIMGESNRYQSRNEIVSGFHGKSVLYVNSEYSYFRGPARIDNYPCFEYKCMPTTFHGAYHSKYSYTAANFASIEIGRFLEHTNYPQYKFTRSIIGKKVDEIENYFDNELYVSSDNKQLHLINNQEIEQKICYSLISVMKHLRVPSEQYQRLGLERKK